MILAVFRARAHSLEYAERLRAHGVQATTIPAPKETRIGCGLCVRFEEVQFARAQAILRLGNYKSFKGFYKFEYVGSLPRVFPYTR